MRYLISILTICAIILITALSFSYDSTYFGSINANSNKTVSVIVPSGKSKVEVWALPEGLIDCKFMTANGQVVISQVNTAKCFANPLVEKSIDILVNINNHQNKMIDYRIWIHRDEK
jgi:hypothetical protein